VSGITTSSLTITNLPRGTNLITAIYSGDGNYLGSTNMLDQVVTNHPPVVTGNSYSRNGMTSWSISVSDLLTNATDVDGDTLTVDNAGTSTNLASLVIASGYVTYTNPNLVDDQFTVTVTDGFGGTNSALITLLSGVVGTNSIASLVSGNPTTLTAYGVPDYSYITERSTNLFDWVNIVTNAAATNGMITVRDYFGDLGSNAPTKAYYRLKWQRE
jgi:hypothetical protein